MSRHDSRRIDDVKILLRKGDTGASIASIEKTGTDVLVDTYTVTLTDGTKTTFQVTNGKGISTFAKVGTSGLVDNYLITFNDGTTQNFSVSNGKGISSIEKTDTDVLVDTYTITFNDGTTLDYTVTNGRGIVSIDRTATVGWDDTYTITYNDGTTSTFTVHNGNSGSGSNVTVTTNDPELFGRPVTLTDTLGNTLTQNFDQNGITRFDSVEMDGLITVTSSTQDGYTATNTVTLTYFGNYSTQLSLWRAVVNITSPSELYGASVVVKDSNNVTVDTVTLDALDGTGTFQTFDSGNYTFSYTYHGYTYTETLALTSSATFSLAITKKATVSITSDADIYGYSVVVKNSSNVTVDTVTLDPLDGTASVILFETGTFTFNFVYDGDAYDESITVVAGTTSYSVELSPLKLVSWSSGSDEDIKKMIDAYYAGKLALAKIQSVWAIGDERTVHLSAMSATGVSESHVAQDVQMVIMNWGGKKLASDGTTDVLAIIGQKDNLNDGTYYESGKMNAYNSNEYGWKTSPRRTWCNDVYRIAITSSTMRECFKQFINKTSVGKKSSTLDETSDYFAFPSEIEAFGNNTHSATGEGSQFEYYETQSHRQKRYSAFANGYGACWGRSPSITSDSSYCCIAGDGTYVGYNATTEIGLSPFGCI